MISKAPRLRKRPIEEEIRMSYLEGLGKLAKHALAIV